MNKLIFKKKALFSSVTGFTLIELVVSALLLSVLTGFVVWTFVVGLRAWSTSVNRANLRQSGNLAIEMMVRELSQASEISRARSDEIEFDADLDGDGSVETIKFDVSNDNNLERTLGGSAIIIAGNVQDFILGYYLESDSDNENLLSSVTGPSQDDIRVITVSLILNDGDETVTLSSGAYARNQGL